MRIAIIGSLAAIGLALAACEDRNQPTTGSGTAAPDNTARNERDRGGTTQTPPDQGETEADRTITAEIRRAITEDGSMSVNARNVKIVTSGGVVTLRGPVESQAEKDAIEAKARAVPGVSQVVNELEVKTT